MKTKRIFKQEEWRQRICRFCQRPFIQKEAWQLYCNNDCLEKSFVAQKKADRNKHLLKLRFDILRRDKFTCQYCGRTVEDGAKLHVDHLYPKKEGGNLLPDNLITSCLECNQGKKDVILTKREMYKFQKLFKNNT